LKPRIHWLAGVVALLSSACGGGGGDAPAAATPSTPAPAPAPAPTPVSPPLPPQNFVFETGGRSIGRLDFFPSDQIQNPVDQRQEWTNRSGVFTVGAGDGIGVCCLVAGNGASFNLASPIYGIRAGGFDLESGEYVFARAGPGSTTVSPIGELVQRVGDQIQVKRALGLDSGAFAFLTDRDLRSFSTGEGLASTDAAVRSDGARLAAANIRLLALVAATDYYRRTLVQVETANALALLGDQDLVASYIRTNPGVPVYFDGLERYFLAVPRIQGATPLRLDVIAAYASLVEQYAVAAGAVPLQGEVRAQYLLGIRGWLIPRLVQLLLRNDAAAAAAVAAIRAPTIQAETAIFRDPRLPVNAAARLFPGADMIVVNGGSRTLPPVGDSFPAALTANDLQFTSASIVRPTSTVLAVTVPAANQADIGATLNADQSVTITTAPGFRGISWFAYRVRAQNGEEGEGRGYVIVL
jgi:hypothetical protein